MTDASPAVGREGKRTSGIACAIVLLTLTGCGGGGGGTAPSTTTPAPPTVSLTAASFTFGNQRVGTSSVSQTVGIANVGTADLPISGVALTGSNSSSFAMTSGCGTTLAVNADCTVTITFVPITSGSMSANLVVHTNLSTDPTVALTGTGTASVASPSPTALTFTSQLVISASGPQTVQITNTGTASLNINTVSLTGPDAATFAQTNTCSMPVATSSSCSVSITFAPSTAGNKSAALIIDSDASTNPSIALSGVAVLPPPPSASAAAIGVNVLGVAPTTATGSVNAVDPNGLALHYTIGSGPAQGTATVDSNTGSLSYQIPGYPTSTSISADTFSVIVTNGYTSTTAAVNVSLNADPLLQNQWHIQNIGQNAFASTLPVTGNDINVVGAWTAGYSGKGIKIGVVDSGVEAAHEDLAANIDLSHSFNFITGGNDPTPTTTFAASSHGTAVAGIIGAVAFNGKGGRGIAYNAKLRGYNLIASGAYSNPNLTDAFGGIAVSADNDVFNASFGNNGTSLQSKSQVAVQTDIQATTLRNGLGAPLIYSAGNNFQDIGNANDPLCPQAEF